jgi:hypothetical protein
MSISRQVSVGQTQYCSTLTATRSRSPARLPVSSSSSSSSLPRSHFTNRLLSSALSEHNFGAPLFLDNCRTGLLVTLALVVATVLVFSQLATTLALLPLHDSLEIPPPPSLRVVDVAPPPLHLPCAPFTRLFARHDNTTCALFASHTCPAPALVPLHLCTSPLETPPSLLLRARVIPLCARHDRAMCALFADCTCPVYPSPRTPPSPPSPPSPPLPPILALWQRAVIASALSTLALALFILARLVLVRRVVLIVYAKESSRCFAVAYALWCAVVRCEHAVLVHDAALRYTNVMAHITRAHARTGLFAMSPQQERVALVFHYDGGGCRPYGCEGKFSWRTERLVSAYGADSASALLCMHWNSRAPTNAQHASRWRVTVGWNGSAEVWRVNRGALVLSGVLEGLNALLWRAGVGGWMCDAPIVTAIGGDAALLSGGVGDKAPVPRRVMTALEPTSVEATLRVPIRSCRVRVGAMQSRDSSVVCGDEQRVVPIDNDGVGGAGASHIAVPWRVHVVGGVEHFAVVDLVHISCWYRLSG